MNVVSESWAYKVPFRVSRGAASALDVVVVTLTDAEGHVGRGEAAGVDYDTAGTESTASSTIEA
jgi:L-alanine-DL-glutamate epimerase-like enolase superfamily enzyme